MNEKLDILRRQFLSLDTSYIQQFISSTEFEAAQKAASLGNTSWQTYLSQPSSLHRPLALISLLSSKHISQSNIKPYQLLGTNNSSSFVIQRPSLIPFIAELRAACEPHRDIAREQSEHPDVTKNIQRKAVAAASAVDELHQLEMKAAAGRNMRVEECITAVTSCIRNQDETFKDVLELLERRADELRNQWRDIRKKSELDERMRKLTTGILTNRIQDLEQESDQSKSDIDEDEKEKNMLNKSPEKEKTIKQTQITEEKDQSLPSISSSHLKNILENPTVWPSHSTQPKLNFGKRPPTPFFNVTDYDNEDEEIIQSPNSLHERKSVLSDWIGHNNPVLRNVYATKRLKLLHSAAVDVVTNKLLRSGPVSSIQGGQISSRNEANNSQILQLSKATEPQRSPVKIEDTEIEISKAKPKSSMIEKTEPSIWEIGNSTNEHSKNHNDYELSREHIAARATIALLCNHAGFTHISSHALSLFTDVLGRTIEQIGVSLKSTRELERSTSEFETNEISLSTDLHDPFMHQVRAICSARGQTGLAELHGYANSIPKISQTIIESEMKLGLRLREKQLQIPLELQSKINREAQDSIFGGSRFQASHSNVGKDDDMSDKNSNVDIDSLLQSEAFVFGFLGKNVRLDILEDIKVPWKFAAQKVQTASDGHQEALEPNQESQSDSSSKVQLIKAEASMVDV